MTMWQILSVPFFVLLQLSVQKWFIFFFMLVLHIFFQLYELIEHICATWEQTSMKS